MSSDAITINPQRPKGQRLSGLIIGELERQVAAGELLLQCFIQIVQVIQTSACVAKDQRQGIAIVAANGIEVALQKPVGIGAPGSMPDGFYLFPANHVEFGNRLFEVETTIEGINIIRFMVDRE